MLGHFFAWRKSSTDEVTGVFGSLIFDKKGVFFLQMTKVCEFCPKLGNKKMPILCSKWSFLTPNFKGLMPHNTGMHISPFFGKNENIKIGDQYSDNFSHRKYYKMSKWQGSSILNFRQKKHLFLAHREGVRILLRNWPPKGCPFWAQNGHFWPPILKG